MSSGRFARYRPTLWQIGLAWLMPGLLCLVGPGAARGAEPAAAVDFVRDVLPVLERRCFACHGPERQESDFRLDRRDDALRGGENGVAILPGSSGKSLLVERIAGADADLRMPPKGDLLTGEQVALVRAWIDQGAVWPADAPAATAEARQHWSLRPLVRPPMPAAGGSAAPANPIDAFIRTRLAASGLTPSPEADRAVLLRRVTFDLAGLAPTPQELDAFLADRSPTAYEAVVDRLLASPRYGERWARHWIDVVHFAETHGNDQDRPRPNAWPYRDYLVRSFNEDKPYARFVAEQVAGDALFPGDAQGIVALGFLAAGPWDESSQMGILDDTVDKRIAQVLDRDDMISTALSTFCGATVHCARCHNHKFDPISQVDYYSLQAVFAGVDRAERPFDADPALQDRRRALAERKRAIDALTAAQLAGDAALGAQLAELEPLFAADRDVWKVLAPAGVTSAQGSQCTPQGDGSILFAGTRPERDTYTLTLETDLRSITAIQLEVLKDPSLPHEGPGRQDNGNLHLSEIKLTAALLAGGEPVSVAVASAAADFDQAGWGAARAIDGDPATAWGIYPEVGKSHAAVFVLGEPLDLGGPVRLQVTLEQLHGGGHLIGRARISATTAPHPGAAGALPAAIAALLALEPASRTADQQLELARFLLGWQVGRELSALPAPQMVYAVTNDFKADGNFRPPSGPRAVHVLRRGDISQPVGEAAPGALACVEGLEPRFAIPDPQNESSRRAALARWLADPQNVLTWRTIVNRVWHYHFGRGICDTPNDLGKMGGQPSHPELIDWLAVELRDDGGSLKKLHRLMVTSAAYRQSSQIDPKQALVDADNRLLWRMNRSRLDAECIRDAVLQTSGKLDPTMGGPSVKQFVQTPGIHVTPNVDYQAFDVDDPANFRRSIYRFLFRTLPDPFMESLDCPDGSQLAPTRSGSVTALQALALLDDRFIVRQSEHTAARLTQMSDNVAGQLTWLFRLALLREPAPDELARWQTYASRHGLANACRLMFNTNEFVFVH